MIYQLLIYLLTSVGGMLVGAVFFGSLWFTVSKGVHTRHPALWFGASYMLRLALVIAGFYFLSGGQWPSLLACFLGFMVSRTIIRRWVRIPDLKTGDLRNNAYHET